MRLSGRVRSLERRAGVGAPCPACAGQGRPCYRVVFEPEVPPPPLGCVVCGRVGAIYETVFTCDDGPGDEGRAAACA